MKAFTAKYKYGFLYDTEKKERILLAEDSKLTVTVQEEDLLKEDPYNLSNHPISRAEQLETLAKKGYKEAVEIKSRGDKLYFEITAGVRSKKLETFKCLYEVILQEDLFGARKDLSKDFDLVECHCVVDKCLTDNLAFYEPIYAYSLNDAYSKTYDFYFRLYGKQAANAKERFMEEPGGNKKFLKEKLVKSTEPDIEL